MSQRNSRSQEGSGEGLGKIEQMLAFSSPAGPVLSRQPDTTGTNPSESPPDLGGMGLAQSIADPQSSSLKEVLMKINVETSWLGIAVATLATISFAVAPASAKEKDKSGKHHPPAATTSAAAAASLLGSVPEQSAAVKPGQYDSKPGMAWKTVGGTVKDIQGETYTVEDYDGSQMKVRVGQGTKQLRGHKKVGDTIRAEITHGGFANSIQ